MPVWPHTLVESYDAQIDKRFEHPRVNQTCRKCNKRIRYCHLVRKGSDIKLVCKTCCKNLSQKAPNESGLSHRARQRAGFQRLPWLCNDKGNYILRTKKMFATVFPRNDGWRYVSDGKFGDWCDSREEAQLDFFNDFLAHPQTD